MSGDLDATATARLLDTIDALAVPHFQRHFEEHPDDFSLPSNKKINDTSSISVSVDIEYFVTEENEQQATELLESNAEDAQTKLLKLLFNVNDDGEYQTKYGLSPPPTLLDAKDGTKIVQVQIRIESLIRLNRRDNSTPQNITQDRLILFNAVKEHLELKHLVEFYERGHPIKEKEAKERNYLIRSEGKQIEIVDLTAAYFLTAALYEHKDALDRHGAKNSSAAASAQPLPTVNLAEFFSHIPDPLIKNLGIMLEKQASGNKQKQPEKKPKPKYFFSGILPSYRSSKSKTVTKDIEPSDLLSQGEIQRLSTNFQNTLTELCLNFPAETLQMITNDRLSCIEIAELIGSLVENIFPNGIDAVEYVNSKNIDILDARVLHDQLWEVLRARYALEEALVKNTTANNKDNFIQSVHDEFKEFSDELDLAEKEEKEAKQEKINSAGSSASTAAVDETKQQRRRSTILSSEFKRASTTAASTTENRRRSSIFHGYLNNDSPKSSESKRSLSSIDESSKGNRRKSLLPANTTSRRVANSGIPSILQRYEDVNITDIQLNKALKSKELTVMADALGMFLNEHENAIKQYTPEKSDSQKTHDDIIAQACALYRVILTEHRDVISTGKDPFGNKDVIHRLQTDAAPLIEAATLGEPDSSKRKTLNR